MNESYSAERGWITVAHIIRVKCTSISFPVIIFVSGNDVFLVTFSSVEMASFYNPPSILIIA